MSKSKPKPKTNRPKRNARVFVKPYKVKGRKVMLSNLRDYRRSYKRNPPESIAKTFGMDKGTLKSAAFVAGGVVGTPFVSGFVNGFLPTSITSNQFGRYAINIASALGLSFVGGKILGKEAAKLIAVGGFAYVAVCALKDFMPSLFGSTTALSGMGFQPMLGAHNQRRLGMYSGMGSRITSQIPDRLRPESRF